MLECFFLKIIFSNSRNNITNCVRVPKSCVIPFSRRTTITFVTSASLPDAPIGEVAGVMLWTFRPRLWDGPGAGAPAGGVSRWGDVSGVVGWEDGPPASRARRLRRICTREIKQRQINAFVCTSGRTHTPWCPLGPRYGGVFTPAKLQISSLYFLPC